MTGRSTRLGLSRWAGTGGSYRTVQRFCSTVIPWALLLWVFFRQQVYGPDEAYLRAGDEVVVTTAGKSTHGLERFFSSLSGKPVPGLSFFTVSLVSVHARRALPRRVEQGVRSAAEKAASKAKAEAPKPQSPREKRRPGRPQGRTNKHKAPVTLTPELARITALLAALRALIARVLPLTYLGRDGPCGHPNARPMARQCN